MRHDVLKDDIIKAAEITAAWSAAETSHAHTKVDPVPPKVLAASHGVVFLHYLKAGAVVSATIGTGFVIARINKGEANECWSAPSALSTGGMGIGFQIGAEKAHNAVILNTPEAKDSFTHKMKITLGATSDLSDGIANNMRGESAILGAHDTSSYTYAGGTWAGIGLDSAALTTDKSANKEFYGREATPEQLLASFPDAEIVKKYPQLQNLYANLDAVLARA
mmetsp:Transcript_5135/g.12369  ORF Transcript_5135/g.12369 Transcript_5135/m.12369 type:complete len:222 (+) Transcript_5135:90-755(+)